MNPRKLRPYLLAEEIKFQKRNRESHLLGMYVFDAVSIALANSFRKKGQKAIKYPSDPYEFISADEKKRLEQQRKKEEEIKRQFEAFADRMRQRLKEKENG